MRLFAVLVMLVPVLAAAKLDTASVSTTRITRWTDVYALIPARRIPQLHGRVIGVLFASEGAPWGRPYDSNGNLPQGPVVPPNRRFWFSRDGSNAYELASPSIIPGARNTFGLSRSIHLVELDAAESKEVYVSASALRVVDDLEDLMIALRKRFDATVAASRAAFDAMKRAAKASAPGCTFGPEGATVGVWPTWLTDEDAIQVLFTSVAAPQHDGGPCASAAFGLHVAASYKVTRAGKLVAETIYAPTAVGTLPTQASALVRAKPDSHLTVTHAVLTICGDQTSYAVEATVRTTELLLVEAVRYGTWCDRVMRPEPMRVRAQGPQYGQGEVVHLGGAAQLYNNVFCGSRKLGDRDGEILYRIDNVLYTLPFKLDVQPGC